MQGAAAEAGPLCKDYDHLCRPTSCIDHENLTRLVASQHNYYNTEWSLVMPQRERSKWRRKMKKENSKTKRQE